MDDRQIEELFVRSNRLDLVQAFADDLAHEIKNPLHSIALHVEILRRRLAKGDGLPQEEVDRYFNRLAIDVEQASGRLELLLRLTRSARERSGATLNEVVHSVEELFQVEAKRHSLQLHLKLGDAGGVLAADVPSVRQAVLNMLRVACARAPQRAGLIVRTDRIGEVAELSIVLDLDAADSLAPDREATRKAAQRVAEASGLELTFSEEGAEGVSWQSLLRIPLSSGTPGPSSGV